MSKGHTFDQRKLLIMHTIMESFAYFQIGYFHDFAGRLSYFNIQVGNSWNFEDDTFSVCETLGDPKPDDKFTIECSQQVGLCTSRSL